MTTHLSRADVVTDAPARHARQLVSHQGRKVAFTSDGATSTAAVDGMTLAITVADTALGSPSPVRTRPSSPAASTLSAATSGASAYAAA